jgi:hypothetical protein
MSNHWISAREALVPQVEEAFVTASPSFKPPREQDCRWVAGDLMIIRNYKEFKAPRYDQFATARRHGKDFLVALEAARQPSPELDVSELCRQIEWALLCLGEPRDPIRFLAEKATSAWASANGGKFPRSREKDGSPLVKVVVKLLELAGIATSLSNVSATLKNQRRLGSR